MSLIDNTKFLLISYAFPFGFGISGTFLVGTLLTALYYPTNDDWHIAIMCIISAAVPIGFQLMNFVTFFLIQSCGWEFTRKRIGFIEIFLLVLFTPFFTRRFLNRSSNPTAPTIDGETSRNKSCRSAIFFWMIGIFMANCSISNFLHHLVITSRHFLFNSSKIFPLFQQGHLNYLNISLDRAELWSRSMVFFDAFFRLSIPIFIRLYPVHIINLFPASTLAGFVFLLLTYGFINISFYPLAILSIPRRFN